MRDLRPKPVVFIVDSDVAVRESLARLIRTAGWEPETFDSAKAFLASPAVDVPSCMILDVSFPDLSGLELQQHLVQDHVGLPIIFVAEHSDVPTTVRAMKAGAVDFLTKPISNSALLSAVANGLEKSRAASGRAAELREVRNRYDSLSRREHQVMTLVVSGLLNKQIGGELRLSEITVKAHRGRVMRKMKAESLAQLVRLATTLGIPIASRSDAETAGAFASCQR